MTLAKIKSLHSSKMRRFCFPASSRWQIQLIRMPTPHQRMLIVYIAIILQWFYCSYLNIGFSKQDSSLPWLHKFDSFHWISSNWNGPFQWIDSNLIFNVLLYYCYSEILMEVSVYNKYYIIYIFIYKNNCMHYNNYVSNIFIYELYSLFRFLVVFT